MPRLDRAAASASFTAQIRALTDWGVLRQDEGDAFLADLAAQVRLPKSDPIREDTLAGMGQRLCKLFVDGRLDVPAVTPLLQDILDVAEHVYAQERGTSSPRVEPLPGIPDD